MIPSLRPPREPYDRYDPTAPGAPRDPTAALRRRVFSVGLPVGLATTVLVWIFERADGLIHAVDLYGIPLVALGLVLAWAALRSGARLDRIERGVFALFTIYLVASMVANFFLAAASGIPLRGLGGAGCWFPVLYALAYLIWGADRGRDHFKRVNDDHGHDVGDAVLRAVARLLRSELRDGDTLVRWGGEEFAVLAPEHDREGAMKLAERLRAAVASHDFGAAGPLSASVGVVLGTPDIGAAELFRLADGALYRAKEAGRDRIELAAEQFPPRLRVTPKPAG